MRETRQSPGKSLVTVISYPRDTVISISGLYQGDRARGLVKARGKVTECSFKSLRRASLIIRNIMESINQFVVLTYPADFPMYGKKVKRDVDAFNKYLRRQGIKYFWFLEFQTRGAPHVNYLLTKTVSMEDLQETWYRIVGSGDWKHRYMGVYADTPHDKNKLSTYLAGYFTKKDARKVAQRQVPEGYSHVGRFWGMTRGLVNPEIVAVLNGDHFENMRKLRPVLKLNKANCRAWGWKWKHKGKGFTSWSVGQDTIKNLIGGSEQCLKLKNGCLQEKG